MLRQYVFHLGMVDRGRWLGIPANFKYSEHRTHLEVEHGFTVHKIFLKLIWYGETTEHKRFYWKHG